MWPSKKEKKQSSVERSPSLKEDADETWAFGLSSFYIPSQHPPLSSSSPSGAERSSSIILPPHFKSSFSSSPSGTNHSSSVILPPHFNSSSSSSPGGAKRSSSIILPPHFNSSSSSSPGGIRRPFSSSNTLPPNFCSSSSPSGSGLSVSLSSFPPQLKSHSGSSTSTSSTLHPDLLDTPWRTHDWSKRHGMKEQCRTFRNSSQDVNLRILIHGPVGAGKSSFINSIDSIFQDRMASTALAASSSGHSFTKTFQTHSIKDQNYGSFLPFNLCDIMGLEEGNSEGVKTDDLIKILKGHIRDGYTFNTADSSSEGHPQYNSNPTLKDRIHCLVSAVPASTLSMMSNDVFRKMRAVRAEAATQGIPQVAILTKVDEMCPWVAEDTKLVYRSKKIKDKMQDCSNRLGVPMNCIFPVKNYHEETQLNNDVDVLLLSALTTILHFANDHVAVMAPPPVNMRKSRLGQNMDTEQRSVEHDFKSSIELNSRLEQMDSKERSMDRDVNFRDSEQQYSTLQQMDYKDPSMDHDVDFNDSKQQYSTLQQMDSKDPSMDHDVDFRDSKQQYSTLQQMDYKDPSMDHDVDFNDSKQQYSTLQQMDSKERSMDHDVDFRDSKQQYSLLEQMDSRERSMDRDVNLRVSEQQEASLKRRPTPPPRKPYYPRPRSNIFTSN